MTPRLLVQAIERLQLPFTEKGKFVWVAQILGENQEFVFGLIKFEIRCLSGKNQVSIGNANWSPGRQNYAGDINVGLLT